MTWEVGSSLAQSAKKRKSSASGTRTARNAKKPQKKTLFGTGEGSRAREKSTRSNRDDNPASTTLAQKISNARGLGARPSVRHLSRALREILGIAAIAASLIAFLALFTFDINDPGWSHTGTGVRVENSIGRAGAWFADVFLYLFGYVAYLFPLMLAHLGWNLFRDRDALPGEYQPFAFVRIAGIVLLFLAASGLSDLHVGVNEGTLPHGTFGGGIVGTTTAWKLVYIFKPLGATLVLLAVFFCSLTLALGSSWIQLIESMGTLVLNTFHRIQAYFKQLQDGVVETRKVKAADDAREAQIRNQDLALKKQNSLRDDDDPLFDDLAEFDRQPERGGPLSSLAAVIPNRISGEGDRELQVTKGRIKGKKKLKIGERKREEKQFPLFKDVPDSDLPPLALLDPPQQRKIGFTDKQLEAMSRLLENKLADFNITVEVVAVHPGPVITRFELQPSPGVKARQITNLTQDIARSLSIVSVRVVEVIAGKSTIGLEIPNDEREIIQLSELLQSQQYEKSSSPLTLALGKDISGIPVVADLSRMPHLLVAGTTGSGKSVAVNAMLLSLLYKATPRDVRLILIDPKMLELNIYDGIPHLLTPVVTDMKEAANALRWSVGEMERRYKLMASLGVRNLAGFNKKVSEAIDNNKPIVDPLYKAEKSLEPTAAPPTLEPFPCIVVVIDEFADMMMQVGKKAEELIARIAQKARAAGIHLVLATQRPSVDVITGLIKANIPTRIAFQVSSRIDSRTIIDQMGAETLLGHGDMLYLPPGTAIPERVHGAFVDDHEVHAVAAHIKQSGEPNYIESVIQESGPVPGMAPEKGESDGEADPLYDQAVAIVCETRKASISYVQRRLKIGYNRAARMIEEMEAAGVVSKVQSNGSREVLAPPPVDV